MSKRSCERQGVDGEASCCAQFFTDSRTIALLRKEEAKKRKEKEKTVYEK